MATSAQPQPRSAACAGLAPRAPVSVALPVLPSPAKVRKSRVAGWRAAVLILVHVIFAVHMVQWVLSGMRDDRRETLSPVEPSESMQTLEQGLVNAGFVMFALAILSTLILGRFFCGWLCHVVALQDLCGWVMKKCGVHPKPWRSRLLLWVPLGLALYMFVWPTFRREVVAPLMDKWFGGMPAWMGAYFPRPQFQPHFIIEDFWATFPPWYIAIPFLSICGFAIVYFLGAKAFCSYGCPYGGFFGPADLVAPVRIRVTDACHQCGHCTAVCTSNVRVHEEVRDFAMVVDPGCMKCLDCISVCPTNALYLGAGKPAVAARPRSDKAVLAKAAANRKGRFDLTWGEEVVLLGVFLLFLRGYRGMYDSVPLLMSGGIAAVCVFAVHKTWRMFRDANVRGPYWQLKRAGRWTGAGRLFALATLAVTLVGAQGLVMWFCRWQAEMTYPALDSIPPAQLFAPGFKATDAQRQAAERIIRLDRLAGPMNDGGVGFMGNVQGDLRLWWASAVLGDLKASERYLRRALDGREPRDDLVIGLAELMRVNGASQADAEHMLTTTLHKYPRHAGIRRYLAERMLAGGRAAETADMFERAARADIGHVATVSGAAELLMALGPQYRARAVEIVQEGLKHRPGSAVLLEDLGTALFLAGRGTESVEPLRRAVAIEETQLRWVKLGDILEELGRPDEAREARARAAALAPKPSAHPPGR